jgi:hypothetical protein
MSVAEQRSLVIEQGVLVQLGRDCLSVQVGQQRSTIELPARLAHRGSELKLIVKPDASKAQGRADPTLTKLVVLAMAAQRTVLSGKPDPLVSHYSKRHFSQLLRISWLAPDILASILDGRHPLTLTGRSLLRSTAFPLDWLGQQQLLGRS